MRGCVSAIAQTDVSVSNQVEHLARMAKDVGLDGVVASPREIKIIRAACGPKFLIVTPGVRPAGGESGDQRRIATPAGAVQAGSDILVIGRPITAAKDPVKAADNILKEIQDSATGTKPS